MENTEKKIKVLIKPQCDAEIRNRFITKFGEKCEFVFEENEIRDSITTAEVVIGEPEESELRKAENLHWIQLTWAVYWKNKQECLWVQNRSSDTIYGKNVLILGTGDIGKNIAHRMQAFETHVTGIKRTAVSEHSQQLKDFDEVYDLTALDDKLPQADIVIGCLPGTLETKGLLNYDCLHSMKKDAVLINVGRGSLIPTEDLIRALQEGHLKGAVLDVFETEPLPFDSPLWEMDQVILTPHIAGPSFGGNAEVQDMIWNICMENLERYLNGKELKNIVRLNEGY